MTLVELGGFFSKRKKSEFPYAETDDIYPHPKKY